MIAFFRKIRQQLMADNKTGKYLLYALGEIALVVIGIMIAVSLNNSNEIKKQKAEEQQYLKGLKEEFLFNKEGLTAMINRNMGNLEAGKTLLEYVTPQTPRLTEAEFDQMIEKVFLNEVQFSPSPGVLHEITNSGKLGSFSDPELKKALGAWEAQLVRVKFQEQEEVLKARYALIDIVTEHGNTRRATFDNLGQKLGYSNSKFKGQNQKLLQMEEFENALMDFILTSHFLNVTYYNPLDKQIDAILELIEANILTD